MNITNLQAVVFVNTASEMKQKPLPVKLAFAIRHNYNLVMDQIKAYEEARLDIINSTEDVKVADAEVTKLLNESVEQPIKTVSLAELEKVDKWTIQELDAIAFMTEE